MMKSYNPYIFLILQLNVTNYNYDVDLVNCLKRPTPDQQRSTIVPQILFDRYSCSMQCTKFNWS